MKWNKDERVDATREEIQAKYPEIPYKDANDFARELTDVMYSMLDV